VYVKSLTTICIRLAIQNISNIKSIAPKRTALQRFPSGKRGVSEFVWKFYPVHFVLNRMDQIYKSRPLFIYLLFFNMNKIDSYLNISNLTLPRINYLYQSDNLSCICELLDIGNNGRSQGGFGGSMPLNPLKCTQIIILILILTDPFQNSTSVHFSLRQKRNSQQLSMHIIFDS
jgi:hypothetical protein